MGSSLDFAGTEETILLTGTFFAALLFLTVYTIRRRWWQEIPSLALGWLAIGVTGVLLHSVLVYWHVIHPKHAPDLAEWVSIQCIAILPLCFLSMTWLVIRPLALPWLVRHHLARSFEPHCGLTDEDPTPERQSSR